MSKCLELYSRKTKIELVTKQFLASYLQITREQRFLLSRKRRGSLGKLAGGTPIKQTHLRNWSVCCCGKHIFSIETNELFPGRGERDRGRQRQNTEKYCRSQLFGWCDRTKKTRVPHFSDQPADLSEHSEIRSFLSADGRYNKLLGHVCNSVVMEMRFPKAKSGNKKRQDTVSCRLQSVECFIIFWLCCSNTITH